MTNWSLTSQPYYQLLQRLRPVAEFVFNRLAQLREGMVVSDRHKQRVVAKTTQPPGCKTDPAFADTLKDERMRIEGGFRQSQHTSKTRRALLQRNMLKEAQQFCVVGIIRRISL